MVSDLGKANLAKSGSKPTQYICCSTTPQMLYFQQQIFSFLACFSSIPIKAPNFPIIPEWLQIEENQNEYHPDALNNVHDRELQLYISQFFIVQVQRMNHQKFIWNIISLERATLSILVEWRAVEKSFDEKANDLMQWLQIWRHVRAWK